jgi:hypothetical protein
MSDESNSAGDPGAVGTRVARTGIALVHEGELILPAQGGDAQLQPARGDGAVAQYLFPVEIEVLTPPDPPDPQEIVDMTLARLALGLEGA